MFGLPETVHIYSDLRLSVFQQRNTIFLKTDISEERFNIHFIVARLLVFFISSFFVFCTRNFYQEKFSRSFVVPFLASFLAMIFLKIFREFIEYTKMNNSIEFLFVSSHIFVSNVSNFSII